LEYEAQTGKAYDVHLCLFRYLALVRDYGVNELKGQTKTYLKAWLEHQKGDHWKSVERPEAFKSVLDFPELGASFHENLS